MLLSARRLIGRTVLGADGPIGGLRDLFFTERSGNVRFAVVKTGAWLDGREILLAPQSFDPPAPDSYEVHTPLSRHLFEHSPPVGDDLPISRVYDERLQRSATQVLAHDGDVDSELRSVVDVIGHHLQATDGEIGHLDDLLVDAARWEVVFAVAKTRNWLPGRTVLLPRSAVRQLRWDTKEVSVDLTRDEVRAAPELDEAMLRAPG